MHLNFCFLYRNGLFLLPSYSHRKSDDRKISARVTPDMTHRVPVFDLFEGCTAVIELANIDHTVHRAPTFCKCNSSIRVN